MNDTLRLLVDTNVWIDSYLVSRANHEQSFALINKAIDAESTLLYGSSKLETVFYVIRAAAKREIRAQKGELDEADAQLALRYAWGCVNNICDIATGVGVDQADIWLARKYRVYHPDMEDNVLLAAAGRCEADYLVTWDEQLLKNASALVRAVTPVTMCTVLEQRG